MLYLFTGKTKTLKTPKTPKSLQRQPLAQYNSPVFLSDSGDDSDIVIKSTWRTRHSRPASKPSSQERDISSKECEPKGASRYFPSPLVSVHTPKPSSAPPLHSGWRDGSASSEDEFQSLLDRIRKHQQLGSSSTHASPKHPSGKVIATLICSVEILIHLYTYQNWVVMWASNCIWLISRRSLSLYLLLYLLLISWVCCIEPKAACVTPSMRSQKDSERVPVKGSSVNRTPAQLPVSRPVSQTEPRGGCISR